VDIVRVPLTVIEETFLRLDRQGEPCTSHVEIGLGGRLEEDRLRAAVASALGVHAMARARLAPGGPVANCYWWEIPAAPDLDSLGVVDSHGATDVAAERSMFVNRSIPLDRSPGIRVVLARAPRGDRLLLGMHHAIGDGVGMLRVLRSVERAYRGVADPVPDVDPLAVRDVETLHAPTHLVDRLQRTADLLRRIGEASEPPTRVARAGDSHAGGYALQRHALPLEQLAREPRAVERATLNDLLLAALHQAVDQWNADHGVRSGRISVTTTVNLRPREWRQEIVANLSLFGSISTHPSDRATRLRTLETVAAQTRRLKERHTARFWVGLFGHSHLVPTWVRSPVFTWLSSSTNPFLDTAVLSNIGVLAPFDFGPRAGPLLEAWFSAPVWMPVGLLILVASTGGTLHLVLRHHLSVLDEAAAAEFMHLFASLLQTVG